MWKVVGGISEQVEPSRNCSKQNATNVRSEGAAGVSEVCFVVEEGCNQRFPLHRLSTDAPEDALDETHAKLVVLCFPNWGNPESSGIFSFLRRPRLMMINFN